MQISDKGLDLIKRFEGMELNSYQDVAGVWTVGMGTTRINGKPVPPGLVIDEEEAERLFRIDFKQFEKGVSKLVSNNHTTQSQFDALVSLAYNIGLGAFKKSEALRHHKNMDYHQACRSFLQWVSAGGQKWRGLMKRRCAEALHYSMERWVQ